jgi:phage terminase large subunit GpA-like protein
MARLSGLAASLLRPAERTAPDRWAATHRTYGPTSGLPGPRNPGLTPYVVPFELAVAEGAHRRYVLTMGAQSGKTDAALDLIGHRLDQNPAPILYVGPSRDFITDQFEPRLMTLLDEALTLQRKVVRGRRMKKTLKIVAGVPVRLAHGGSSTALKSDPAALALVDEYDEMLRNVRGQGDVLGLVEARGFTYADFAAVITSTPSRGVVDTEIDPASGLEFWKVAEAQDLESGIWKLFQEGTRYHWAWPCVHCGAFFIPRFKHLKWPEGCTPAEARRKAWMECPHCGCLIEDTSKSAMNGRGRYVAPGQTVTEDGDVTGNPPESSTCSFWVSGLASPFVSWGQRAEDYLKAFNSGDDHKIQTAINAGFGECYAEGVASDALDWKAVAARRRPYKAGEVPLDVIKLTAGIDVQMRSLYYVIRGWGAKAQSWLIDAGQLIGPTDKPEVWEELTEILLRPYDGLHIERALVDSGFRPGKPGAGDDHAVYEYVRTLPWLVYPTKGHAQRAMPISDARIEVTSKGQRAKRSMILLHIDSDFFKSLVHSRLRAVDGAPGAIYLPEDATDDYCQQLVSEWRAISPDNSKAYWIVRNRRNHFLDAEALAAAAGYMLKVHTFPDGIRREPRPDAAAPDDGGEAQELRASLRNKFAAHARRRTQR